MALVEVLAHLETYTLGSFKNYASSKLPVFDPFPLVHSCSFYMYSLPQRTFALVSYPPLLSKKVSRRFGRLFRIKNQGVKRVKRINIFENSA